MNRFKMLARDNNSSPTQYRTWVVDNAPDFTGAQYTGLKSGDIPFDDTKTYVIIDDSIVADFNLPTPQDWISAKRTLPEPIYNSQLAAIDGYVYLFGGAGLNKIFRADLNNPADWVDTGATLPNIIYNSQLAIVNGYVYLFGGNDGYGTINHIYNASISDPLSWTDQGALLPSSVEDHQLVIVNNYIYLLGGREGDQAKDSIYYASTADPLTWNISGGVLLEKLYGSHVGIVNDVVYLFGGLHNQNTGAYKIYSAPITDLTAWSFTGILPHPSFYGQFFTIGSRGYLITPTEADTSFTRILRCNLSDANAWVDIQQTVPGNISNSQLAIIDDRLFLFGGNSNTAIYVDVSMLEYVFSSADAVAYGNITRTQVNATADPLDLFKVLGFPYWKTTYL